MRPFAEGIGVLRTYSDSSGRATRALRIATRSGVHGQGCSILVEGTRLALKVGRNSTGLIEKEKR